MAEAVTPHRLPCRQRVHWFRGRSPSGRSRTPW